MLDTNTITGILTVILPTVIGIIRKLFKLNSDTQIQVLIAVVSFIVSLALELLTRPFVNWADLVGRSAIIFGATQGWYNTLYNVPVLTRIAGTTEK